MRRCIAIGDELRGLESLAVALCKAKHTGTASEHFDPSAMSQTSLADECNAHGFGFFYLCAQLWASNVIAYSATRQIHPHLSNCLGRLSEQQDLMPLPDWMDPEPSAQHIAHEAARFFSPQAGLWSAQSATFPLSTALGYFIRTGRRESESYKMITRAFAEHRAGVVLKHFLSKD